MPGIQRAVSIEAGGVLGSRLIDKLFLITHGNRPSSSFVLARFPAIVGFAPLRGFRIVLRRRPSPRLVAI
jgi:hypothetical protein